MRCSNCGKLDAVDSNGLCDSCRAKRLEEAAQWILNDADYKAPEQLSAEYVTNRWLDRLKAALAEGDADA